MRNRTQAVRYRRQRERRPKERNDGEHQLYGDGELGRGLIGAMAVAGGNQALNGWTVEFDAGFSITNIWNAEIISHVGTHYVIRNASYNGQVAVGQPASFGFQAAAGSGGTKATGFMVNGTDVGPSPTLSVADAAVVEGNSGTQDLAFVRLSRGLVEPGDGRLYQTANGTATAGSDYTTHSGTLTFRRRRDVESRSCGGQGRHGRRSQRDAVPHPVVADWRHDRSCHGDGHHHERRYRTPLSIANATSLRAMLRPRHGIFTVTLSKAATSPVSVLFATTDETAIAGSD